MDRLLHAWRAPSDTDFRAGIVGSVGDYRPAEIPAGFRNIDLVSTTRAMLMDPKRAGLGMDRGALGIAMAV